MSFVIDEKKIGDALRTAVQRLIDENREDTFHTLLVLIDAVVSKYKITLSIEPKETHEPTSEN
jgi:hypothetical protein